MGGTPTPFAENSAKIINLIFEPFPKVLSVMISIVSLNWLSSVSYYKITTPVIYKCISKFSQPFSIKAATETETILTINWCKNARSFLGQTYFHFGCKVMCTQFCKTFLRKVWSCNREWGGGHTNIHYFNWLCELCFPEVYIHGVQQNCIHFNFMNFSASEVFRHSILGIFQHPFLC